MDQRTPAPFLGIDAGSCNRRQFVGGTSLGLCTALSGKRFAGPNAAQQSSGVDGLVTVSAQSTPVWIRNFNPLLAEDLALWPTIAGVYEPLLIHNTMTAAIVPWLATAYAFSSDNRTLTFTLREGVRWSDGQPFTAKDVAFTFELLRAHEELPGTGGIRSVLPLIDTIRVPDDWTVTFQLQEPHSPSLYEIGHQMIVPEHIWSTVDDPARWPNEQPIGTGPFTEVGVFEDQYWELHRNPTYWQTGLPHVRGLRFPALSDSEAMSLGLLDGEVDWASAFIPDIEETFVAPDPENHHYWFPPVGDVVMLYANTTRAPFDDVNVRKAMSMALDREQIVDIAMNGYTRPADATGLSDAYKGWKNADAVASGVWTNRNVAEANRLLDELGYAWDKDIRLLPDGNHMTFELAVIGEWSDWATASLVIASNLEEVGIAATLQTYDFGIWFDMVQKGEFDLSIGWSASGPTPYNVYRSVMSTETVKPIGQDAPENWHRFGLEAADALLEQFVLESDSTIQHELADQLQFLFVDHAPAIPLFPGPQWGQYNSSRFIGFPDQNNPYALLSTFSAPDRLLVLTSIRPR